MADEETPEPAVERPATVSTACHCPVCNSDSAEPYVTFTELAFVRCPSCRAVYKSRETADVRSADFYERDYFHGRKSGRDRRFAHRVRKAMRQIAAAQEYVAAQSLLDVGCSLGYVIEAGERLGLRSSGCDISEYAVSVCQERGYHAEVGTLERLPFDDKSFDIVFMKHVLEHTPDPRGALAEVRRVATFRGVVVIIVPDLDYWKGRLLRRTYRYFRPDDLGRQHDVYYTRAALCSLLERCGFDVVARSKAVLRRKRARVNIVRHLIETARYGLLAIWQSLASALHLRRELFVIARVRDRS